jgi:hypothetical protein
MKNTFSGVRETDETNHEVYTAYTFTKQTQVVTSIACHQACFCTKVELWHQDVVLGKQPAENQAPMWAIVKQEWPAAASGNPSCLTTNFQNIHKIMGGFFSVAKHGISFHQNGCAPIQRRNDGLSSC